VAPSPHSLLEESMSADPRVAQLTERVRAIPDFPKPGILFRDITPLLAHGPSLRLAIDLLAEAVRPLEPQLLVGIESRGFLFGAALAERLGIGLALVRKPGKLPYKSVSETYALEYGSDTLEIHEDAVAGLRCVIVDDLLATGGTAAATARLVTRQGGQVVAFAFLIELAALAGRARLGVDDSAIRTIIKY
jgi:adenine phosphoribosyltransferase